ncbi:glycosyltransferase family 4 protein [Geminicoccus harenae]|uniref:glycosyltransferase family 4 protein n=1 Tax=Geminicoccus harenae TaxID=2498453 RepID=UPI00168BA4B8|nr:glycosyltransferase family 4 protein [Geminicoccus harenae]
MMPTSVQTAPRTLPAQVARGPAAGLPRVAFLGQPRDGLTTSGPQHGSVAIVLAELMRALAGQFQPSAIAPVMTGQVPGEERNAEGQAVYRVPADNRQIEKALELLDPRPMPRSLRPAYYRSYFQQAASVLARSRPDLIHVMSWAQAAPLLREALPHVPLVLHLHDDMLTRVSPELAEQRITPFAAVVTCSRWLAATLQRHVPLYADRIVAIGNGIDPLLFGGPPRPRPAEVRKLVMVGRISPEKGPHVLLDAFVRIASSYPSLTLDLIGPPGFLPLRQARLMARGMPAMQEAVDRLYGKGLRPFWTQLFKPGRQLQERLLATVPKELHRRIRFLGPQSHDRLAELYREADVLVQPSVWKEAFGMPVAEAMAAGLPVIASADAGLLDLVEHGRTGLLVPPGDAAALAAAIADLAAHPARAHAYGAAGRKQALASHTWDVVAQRLAGVYDRVLTGTLGIR